MEPMERYVLFVHRPHHGTSAPADEPGLLVEVKHPVNECLIVVERLLDLLALVASVHHIQKRRDLVTLKQPLTSLRCQLCRASACEILHRIFEHVSDGSENLAKAG